MLIKVVTMMFGFQIMSDYNWCHGPDCHRNKQQQEFVVKKVLRTKD